MKIESLNTAEYKRLLENNTRIDRYSESLISFPVERPKTKACKECAPKIERTGPDASTTYVCGQRVYVRGHGRWGNVVGAVKARGEEIYQIQLSPCRGLSSEIVAVSPVELEAA